MGDAMKSMPIAHFAGSLAIGRRGLRPLFVALAAVALAMPATGQQVPSGTVWKPQPLHLDPLPPPAAERPGVTIGWYKDVAAARDRALREGKPLIVLRFNASPIYRKGADDIIRQVLPCGELNGLAGRAVFAAEWSDEPSKAPDLLPPDFLRSKAAMLVSVYLAERGGLRRVRDLAFVNSAIGLAAELSPFVGPVDPSAKPSFYGNEHPSRCLATVAAGAGSAPRTGWHPPFTASLPPIFAELKPDVLYERFRASVFVLLARGPSGDMQGSAVAVTPTHLLTNCHVLEGAQHYAVVPTWAGSPFCPVVLETADVANDRCWIRLATPPAAREAAICGAARSVPAGVRPVTSLRVGERVYAIGTPQGLPWTLTDGLISQIRTIDGIRQVQTSAPITHGSSGGALFDASGNLVGITSWGVVKDNAQGLNFAIAAEDFFKP